MSRRPTAMIGILRAILRFGPGVTNSQIKGVTRQRGCNIARAIKNAERNGYIIHERNPDGRIIRLTENGHYLLEEWEDVSGDQSKPAAAYYKSEARNCLKCCRKFQSSWPGERICVPCKSNEDWRSTAAAALVAQEIS